MEFIKNYSVADLKPAEYNPRVISNEAFKKLKESILNFGIIKPVIINDDSTIVAGHQRIKAAKELNINKIHVIKLEKVSKADEIKFNLFHNSVETNLTPVKLLDVDKIKHGYNFVMPDKIMFEKNSNPVIVKEICKLILKYGPWGNVVCDKNGKILANSDYAVAAKLLNSKLLVCKIKNSKKFNEYISINYGKYYFDLLKTKDYNQTFCQMNRLKGKKKLKSSTYEKYILPHLNKNIRILDFGAGKCAYANYLKSKQYKIFMYEPFIRHENSFNIDQVVFFINEIKNDIKQNGLYGIVVLDSVLNSISSLEMQHHVLLTVNSLIKNEGELIVGTRSLGCINRFNGSKKALNLRRSIEFLDDNNFGITFRNNVWTKQRFTNKATLKSELQPYFKEVETCGNERQSTIYAICKKPIRWDKNAYANSLNAEFNMTYPGGFKHNGHDELIKVILDRL